MKLRNISHDNLHFFKKGYWTIISSTNSMFQSPSFKFKNKTGTSQGVAISKAQKAQNIFFWKTVLALTYFFRLKSSHCTMKTLKNLMKQNFWHFLSSHFKRKHFKNTLNTYLFFVGQCGCQNVTNHIFIIMNEKSKLDKNVKLRKFLIFRQLCGHLSNFF